MFILALHLYDFDYSGVNSDARSTILCLFQINMRNTPEKKHWSFVLNKVKVHGVMDFLTLVKVFLTSDVSSPERLLKEHITGLPPVAPAPVKEVDKRDFDINVSVISTELGKFLLIFVGLIFALFFILACFCTCSYQALTPHTCLKKITWSI